ncbi:MAG TPA: cytochrome c3 family protein [Verrucomicrobiae bacterium]
MKKHSSLRRTSTCLTALALAAVWVSSTTNVSAQALQPSLNLRQLTPQEKKDYSLSTAQGASGLSTVGVGQPAYLDVQVNSAFLDENITNVEWVVTSKPVTSTADLLESPLGVNVPPGKIVERSNKKVAARKMLRPDAAGQYTVRVTLATKTAGTTNLTQTITAANYMGVTTCKLCHSGGDLAPNIYQQWNGTPHAHAFERAIDGISTDHFGQNCISCHVVGFDANTNAVNGGFDDIAKATGWVFPSVQTNGNWAAMPARLKDVSNIQCENCHGAGSEHAVAALFDPAGSKKAISVTHGAGACAQCHDSLTHHYRTAEWNNSGHAVIGSHTGAACTRCHTPQGFANYTQGAPAVTTPYEVITCSACHDPHNDANPHQLRAGNVITLDDGTRVEHAGSGAFCMNCHQSRTGSYTNSLVNFPLQKPTYPGGSSSFGPHANPAAEMLMGVNGYTYGKDIPSSAHRFAVTNTCVGCHMQETEGTPAFTKAGGHTFKLSYSVVEGGVTNTHEVVEVCVKCHGEMESFNMVKSDYNGDGVIEGVQDEVQKLLDQLNRMLPSSTYRANSNDYVADGVTGSFTVRSNWPAKFLQAAWNYQLVNNDLSKGVHNAAYAVGLLKASIADLSGDANNDGLADWWQRLYFTDINSANAKPNANPSGDGMPNWLKFALGLDPRVAGTALPDGSGVVFANGKLLGGDTNKIQIFTAAEIAFNTEVGKKYQIQAISDLGGGWANVGAPIDGTGAAMSYVTPTRDKVQQYYRVVTQ